MTAIDDSDSNGILHHDISLDSFVLVCIKGLQIQKAYDIGDMDELMKKDIKRNCSAKGQPTVGLLVI